MQCSILAYKRNKKTESFTYTHINTNTSHKVIKTETTWNKQQENKMKCHWNWYTWNVLCVCIKFAWGWSIANKRPTNQPTEKNQKIANTWCTKPFTSQSHNGKDSFIIIMQFLKCIYAPLFTKEEKTCRMRDEWASSPLYIFWSCSKNILNQNIGFLFRVCSTFRFILSRKLSHWCSFLCVFDSKREFNTASATAAFMQIMRVVQWRILPVNRFSIFFC